MFIHIGADITVRDADVIGIFDLDGAITPTDTQNFLKRCESIGATSSAGDDLPRSFVLLESKKSEKVIFSHISSGRLSKRVNKY